MNSGPIPESPPFRFRLDSHSGVPVYRQMIADARQYVYQSPWNLLLPILAIFLTVTAFNLLGDGLRRTLDVRLAEAGR